MATLAAPVVRHKFYSSDGVTPLASGRVFTYATGTTTPVTTYSNLGGTVANSNPIVLDSEGEATIYLTAGTTYDFIVKRPSPDDSVVDSYIGVTVADTTNAVLLTGNQTVNGEKTFNNVVKSTGSNAGFQIVDRSTGETWTWYAFGGSLLLFTPGGKNGLVLPWNTGMMSDEYGLIRAVPTTTQNGTYTFVATDQGRARVKNDASAYTYTVNNSVHSAGDVLTVVNDNAAGNITIAQGAGVTLYLAGTATTGNRTVAPRGIATIFMVSASVGYVSGPGVT